MDTSKQVQDKENAIKWAKNLLARRYVVLDFETTGIMPCEPVQVAAINHNGVQLMNTLVKPMTYPIVKAASKVHGITADIISQAEAPTFSELWDNCLWKLLDNEIVVAYNAQFEQSVLEHTINLYNLPVARITWSCAMLKYARFHGEWNSYHKSYRWQKLEEACQQMQVSVDGDANDALVDVHMTQALIRKMAPV